MQFCPHCGRNLLASTPLKEEHQELQRPIGCFWYVLIGLIVPISPVIVIYLLSVSNIFTENTIEVIAALLSLGIYPTIWYFAAKGRYNKVNLFGYLNLVALSFVPFANWLVVYYLGKGLYMAYSKQELPNPPKATSVGTIILSVILVVSVIVGALSSSITPQNPIRQPTAASQYSLTQPTSTYRPTQRPILPTVPLLNYKGLPCISWVAIDKSDLESKLCVKGIIYTYGPYSDYWTFIRFSPNSDALQVMDFNYYYYEPLNIGDCVAVYGRIRDYGPHLIITPDKDAIDSVRVGPSSLCK